ncbi:hypothetical protein [Nocardia sp. NPDC046763]|uniref:hypothetical protein n=1 Tax=Nocardia sp. NPDC046763 TaxID=3155256 RepID=UPI0033C1454B
MNIWNYPARSRRSKHWALRSTNGRNAVSPRPNGTAHPYVDTAHRAALMYSFATTLIAVFIELSGWPSAVNFIAANTIVFMFAVTIGNYTRLGLREETDNQMRNPPTTMRFVLVALVCR